ncbi:MAG: hypothetical protein M3R00_08765, partial [Pseudomonadota bacterium]|nr:hypothetical protein [Pseudomonadota bacterium]
MQEAFVPFHAVSRPVLVLDKTVPPEITAFSQMLILLPETGHPFYNSTRPPLYIPWQIKLNSDMSDKALHNVIYNWQSKPVYGKVCAVKIANWDFTARDLLIQYGSDLCTAQKLIVYVEKSMPILSECLATLLSLSLAEELELHFHPHVDCANVDSVLLVANLFCKKLRLVHHSGSTLYPDIFQHLQKIHYIEGVECEKKSARLLQLRCEVNRLDINWQQKKQELSSIEKCTSDKAVAK